MSTRTLESLGLRSAIFSFLLLACSGEQTEIPSEEEIKDDESVPSANPPGVGGAPEDVGPPQPPLAECRTVTACEGDPVGVWSVASSCLTSGFADLDAAGLRCDGVATTGKLEVTGTWTLRADGTVQDETHTSGDVEFEIPWECIDFPGAYVTCDSIRGPIKTVLGLLELSCAEVDSSPPSCACAGVVDQSGSMAHPSSEPLRTGSYTSEDGALVVTDSAEESYAHCASGEALVVSPTAPQGLVSEGMVVLVREE